ncbi:hypothetical protein TUBRATIS_25820 [Tubulinosema ratisbonensis]|uniref:Uncharacterized protein n=1 Tax=Tubulinosema ratisbonensis TaxID=291195 RepID=A0A437AIF3_9MICR|nr:hypothetical protein TUBRATIS_25820 [Tubulinosema ratisbonensis]
MPSIQDTVIICTIISDILFPSLLAHGRKKEGISKNNFVFFYFYACLFFYYLTNKFSDYGVFVWRRFFECIIFRYNKSKMSWLQFCYSFVYYHFVILACYQYKPCKLFYFLNFMFHYLMFFHFFNFVLL